MVTADDQQHTMAPSPASMTALIPLTQANTVLVWDPADRTLIAAHVIGRMAWTERAEPTDSPVERPEPLSGF